MEQKKIIKIIKNRYFISAVLFSIWIGFIDQNNILVDRMQVKQSLSHKIEIKKEYLKKIQETKDASKALEDEKYLEKLAREKYYMKKENEDIFIVTEQ